MSLATVCLYGVEWTVSVDRGCPEDGYHPTCEWVSADWEADWHEYVLDTPDDAPWPVDRPQKGATVPDNIVSYLWAEHEETITQAAWEEVYA